MPRRRTMTSCCVLMSLSVMTLRMYAVVLATDGPQAELEAAQKAYDGYYKEWDSLAMARAATREVAVSARRTAENDLNAMLAAREAKQKIRGALLETARKAQEAKPAEDQKQTLEEAVSKRAAELVEAEKLLAQKLDTMRNSANRLIADTRTAMERTEGFLESEVKLGELLAAIWSANGKDRKSVV